MSASEEIEAKFCVQDLNAIGTRLQSLGARLLQDRTLEINLRFDRPDGSLGRSHRVLRLRRDQQVRLTYKGPGEIRDGVRAREEIEFTVGDFDQARDLLEALGYVVLRVYEKYRREYACGHTHVALDEMPYGLFVEIEGPDAAAIRAMAGELRLDWGKRITRSYLALFDSLRNRRELAFTDLTFANFTGLQIRPADLGVQAADSASNSA